MGYDAFISYCHQDLGWAERLEKALSVLGLKVFRDASAIRAGQNWPAAIRAALDDSRALVLLWSDRHTTASSWVHFEAARMDTRQVPGIKLQVCLEGCYPPFAQWQTIPEIGSSGSYAGGPASIDANVWGGVIERIENAIAFLDACPSVHQVILASTRARMQTIGDTHVPTNGAVPFGALLDQLHLKEKLASWYGDSPPEWKPFGGTRTIQTILIELRSAMLEKKALPFRWKIADKLWTGSKQEVNSLAEKYYEEPCVVVIDGLSLYDQHVQDLCGVVLDECLSNEYAAVMLLPPFTLESRNYLREALEIVAAKLFKQVYREFREARVPKANCNLLTPDDQEMGRLLAAVARSSQKHAALRMK